MTPIVADGFWMFVITLGLIPCLSPVARRLGLIDAPDKRKTHQGFIPLTGGIAIFISLAIGLCWMGELSDSLRCYLIASGILVATGVLDDRFDLNVGVRIFIEIVAASIMIIGADLWVGNLGNLLGLGQIHMPFWLGYPFTLIAVFGILNAINMIDGMDGIAASIALLAIGTLFVITNNSQDLKDVAPLLCGSLLAYLIYNFRPLRFLPKVFLGDAGSKLLGFTLVWMLIDTASSGSSGNNNGIEPATALYIVGLPLIDMVTTTIRRLRKGVSPFHPDRTHIHHILHRAGFSKCTAIAIILALALLFNLAAVAFTNWQVPELVQFVIFFLLFISYSYNIHHAWKLSKKLKKIPGVNSF